MIQAFGLFIFLQFIPRIKDFIKHCGFGCSLNELPRMELAIWDRLPWGPYVGTPLDFWTTVNTRDSRSLPETHPCLWDGSLQRTAKHERAPVLAHAPR